MSAESSASSIFPRTDWAELGRTGEADEARLDRLIRIYWSPLRIFLVATFPSLRDQADVLLQEFAEDKILKKGWLQRADRRRGKFRDFLKTSLRNFVLDRLNRAEFRHPPVPLEELVQEPAAADAPSDEFDLTWARTVLAQTLRRMESDCKDPAADQTAARATSGKCSACAFWIRFSRMRRRRLTSNWFRASDCARRPTPPICC